MSVAGRPDIFPINYVTADRAIYLRSAEGSKLVSVVINRRVAFETTATFRRTTTRGASWCMVGLNSSTTTTSEDYVESLPLFPWNTAPKEPLHQDRGERAVGTVRRRGPRPSVASRVPASLGGLRRS